MAKLKKNVKKNDDIYGAGAVYLKDGIIVGTGYALVCRLQRLIRQHGNEICRDFDGHTAVVFGTHTKRESAIAALKHIIEKIEATPEEAFQSS